MCDCTEYMTRKPAPGLPPFPSLVPFCIPSHLLQPTHQNYALPAANSYVPAIHPCEERSRGETCAGIERGLRLGGRKLQSPNCRIPGSQPKDKGSGLCGHVLWSPWFDHSEKQTKVSPSKSTESLSDTVLAWVLAILIIRSIPSWCSSHSHYFIFSYIYHFSCFISFWVLALLLSFPFSCIALFSSFIYVLS